MSQDSDFTRITRSMSAAQSSDASIDTNVNHGPAPPDHTAAVPILNDGTFGHCMSNG